MSSGKNEKLLSPTYGTSVFLIFHFIITSAGNALSWFILYIICKYGKKYLYFMCLYFLVLLYATTPQQP